MKLRSPHSKGECSIEFQPPQASEKWRENDLMNRETVLSHALETFIHTWDLSKIVTLKNWKRKSEGLKRSRFIGLESAWFFKICFLKKAIQSFKEYTVQLLSKIVAFFQESRGNIGEIIG